MKLLREFAKKSPLIHQEDPVEDVFIGCVNTIHGTFRVFSGIFADGYFIVERLFHFLATKESFPTFQETIDAALALLRLSDAVVKRRRLPRNLVGGGLSAGKLDVPSAAILKTAGEDVEFSETDLSAAAVSLAALDEFILRGDQREAIQGQRMWASNLERRPLVRTETGILVAVPSTICRALVRYMVERIQLTKMGGWAETFFRQENAGIFVNDVARSLGIQMMEFRNPPPPEHLPRSCRSSAPSITEIRGHARTHCSDVGCKFRCLLRASRRAQAASHGVPPPPSPPVESRRHARLFLPRGPARAGRRAC